MSNEQRQKILYGTGAMGKRAYEHYTKDEPNAVYCFADTYKHGQKYMGLPVISIKELAAIQGNFDIVICVWDLFDLLLDFDDEKIYSFEIWNDDDGWYVQKRKLVELCVNRRKVESAKKCQKKILYGAGDVGGDVYKCLGDEAVYAFADKSKAGESYFGKQVLHPSELMNLQYDYEIIISIFKDFYQAAEYLASLGVEVFTFLEFDDVRLMDKAFLDAVYCNATFDSRVIGTLKDLDFIEYPDLVYDYYDKHIRQSRKRLDPLHSPERKWKHCMKRYLLENLMYGKFDELAKYAGRSLEYYEAPAVVHGYPSFECDDVVMDWVSTMFTGELYKKAHHDAYPDCLFFTIGPFFHYTEPFYSDEKILEMKKRQGRNLTAFPMHNNALIKFEYNTKEFVKKVLEEAKQFDSLTVAVYFMNHDDEVVHLFRAEGAKIVSPGFFTDPSFIRRLKTIMLLSDAIVINRQGSAIPHAISLGKPIKLLPQDLKFRSMFYDESSMRATCLNLDAPITKVLIRDDYCITQEMLELYEPIIGFCHIRTREEMGAIFDLSKKLVQNCDYKKSRYIDSIRQTYRSLQNARTADEKLQFRLMREALPEDYDDYLKGLGV